MAIICALGHTAQRARCMDYPLSISCQQMASNEPVQGLYVNIFRRESQCAHFEVKLHFV